MRLAVIGCGQMGLPMARAAQSAGLDVLGRDIRPAADFGDFAPHMAPKMADLADRDTAQVVVRDVPQIENVLFGEASLLSAAPSLATLIISSTVSPTFVRNLPARLPKKIALIDAPMSGAPVAAEERRLSFMLGGDPTRLDAMMPIFNAQGTTHHRLGPLGAGMTAKVLNNLIAAASTVATRTALTYASTLNCEREALMKVLATSSGQTWFGTQFDKIAFAREGFSTDNTMGILQKDVESLLDALPESENTNLPQALIAALHTLKPDT